MLRDPADLLGVDDDEVVDGDEGGVMLTKLAIRYVTQRRNSGHLGENTAREVMYRLLNFCAQAPRRPGAVRRKHVERWMEQPGIAPGYRRLRLSTLRGFCRWCVEHRLMDRDPTIGVEAPRVPEGVPKRLTRDETVAVVRAACRDLRTLVIVLLMVQEGLRRVEISRADLIDVDFAERSLAVRGKGGGGQVTRVVPLSDETWWALGEYLADEGHRHGPLVRNRVRHNPRLAPPTVSQLVHDVMVEAGVKRPGDPSKTPHSLRHTFCHDVLAETADIFAAQRAMGHASVRTTQVYLRGHVHDLREIMGGRSYLRVA